MNIGSNVTQIIGLRHHYDDYFQKVDQIYVQTSVRHAIRLLLRRGSQITGARTRQDDKNPMRTHKYAPRGTRGTMRPDGLGGVGGKPVTGGIGRRAGRKDGHEEREAGRSDMPPP
jgi:hypothetical protein